jgi:cation diffusion facilitator CzcD-associated flavoprotein CzcO
MAKTAPRLAILGAGPIGLEAGLYARALRLPFTIYERGRVADYVWRWGHVRLFSPFVKNVTPLGRAAALKQKPNQELPGDDACLTGREHINAYWGPIAEALQGSLQTDTQVLQVGRRGLHKEDNPGDAARAKQPFRLMVRDKQNRERVEEADVVLDCTGIYGQHRWLGAGGIPAIGEVAAEPHIAYTLDDVLGDRKNHYANKNILVVGAGLSAATTVANLAQLAGEHQSTWVTWIARGASTWPIRRILNDPLKERDRLAVRANNLATRTDANVEFHAQSVVEVIETQGQDKGFRVTIRSAGKQRTLDVERIVGNVGYSPDRMLYRELRIQECYGTFAPAPLAKQLLSPQGGDAAAGPNDLRNPEPNYYILGAKSYGRQAGFLLTVGISQIRQVFTLITGDAGLDLCKTVKV